MSTTSAYVVPFVTAGLCRVVFSNATEAYDVDVDVVIEANRLQCDLDVVNSLDKIRAYWLSLLQS